MVSRPLLALRSDRAARGSLTPGALRERAEAETGLSDWGEGFPHEALDRLLASAQRDAQLTATTTARGAHQEGKASTASGAAASSATAAASAVACTEPSTTRPPPSRTWLGTRGIDQARGQISRAPSSAATI